MCTENKTEIIPEQGAAEVGPDTDAAGGCNRWAPTSGRLGRVQLARSSQLFNPYWTKDEKDGKETKTTRWPAYN